MTTRRAFIGTLAGVLSAPLTATAQAPAKVPRIGYLSPRSLAETAPLLASFRQGLRELGYVEGQTIAIEYRFAEGRPERLPALAAELVRLKVDVIVTAASPAPEAAKQATSTIPIVFTVSADPVAVGLVASLARPGGNITGLANMAPDVVGKQLELLKEVVPKVSRVAVLRNPNNPGQSVVLREAEGAARTLGLQLHIVPARTPTEIETAFAAMRSQRAGAVLVVRDGLFLAQRTQIATLAAKSRLPAVYGFRGRRRRAASWPMERAFPSRTAAPRPTWTRFSTAPSPPACLWSSRRSSSW